MKYVEACECQDWHLFIQPIAADGEILPGNHVQWKCHSWRHTGDCCRWKGAQDYARIAEAVEKHNDWVYSVLTFKQKEWPDWKAQYTESYPMWASLRKRLVRRHGKLPYIQTWERNQKGGLHVNLLINSSSIASGCYQVEWDGKMRWHNDEIEEHAVAVGFGHIHWCQPMRIGTGKGMAGYLSKLSRELVGANGKNQIPFDAPRHFRRLRASRGLLPPTHKGNCTGRMIFAPIDDHVPEEESTRVNHGE